MIDEDSVHGCTLTAKVMDGREQYTQDVRDFAEKQGISEEKALRKGMEEKSIEFKRKGVEVFSKA